MDGWTVGSIALRKLCEGRESEPTGHKQFVDQKNLVVTAPNRSDPQLQPSYLAHLSLDLRLGFYE